MYSLCVQNTLAPSLKTKYRSSGVLVLVEIRDISTVEVTTTALGQQLFVFLVAGSFLPPRLNPHSLQFTGFQRIEYDVWHWGQSPNPRFVLVEGIMVKRTLCLVNKQQQARKQSKQIQLKGGRTNTEERHECIRLKIRTKLTYVKKKPTIKEQNTHK